MKKIAVLFGGRSQEHDVSVLTALQFIQNMDTDKYTPLPIYVTEEGRWTTGDALLKKENYPQNLGKLTRCAASATNPLQEGGELMLFGKKLFGGPVRQHFDAAVLAFHGPYGEDGCLAGFMETAGIPYVGPRPMGAALSMNKMASKTFARGLGINVLDGRTIQRPADGRQLLNKDELKAATKGLKYPVIVKPNHLGSSIGVSKANNAEELNAALQPVFAHDDEAIIEPFVENLVEYNVAVSTAFDGTPTCSAPERPVSAEADELLDFSQKYLNHDGNDSKIQIGEGMASASRVINPDDLKNKERTQIETWAKDLFTTMGLTGVTRFDFLCNNKTRKFWFNEANTIPGSFSYFLWEHATPKILFPQLTTALIEEALKLHEDSGHSSKAPPKDAQIFKR